ncbi:MAG: DNA recombination protein RecN [Epsilonproteobacteria bacterium]|nr:MAG: DNA recombination protein RecN [Campylobacterota bacterium]
MINRFFLEDYLSFEKIDLEFDKGLIVFTGASGAGKSVLMSSILSLFGNSDAKAMLSEVSIDSLSIENEDYNISSNEEFVIKQTNSSKTRNLLNNQTISKKVLKNFSHNFSKHLHLKDVTDFKSSKIISFLDFLAKREDKDFILLLKTFTETFNQLKELKSKLKKINQDESDLDNLIEYTKFEIDKIISINPQPNEYEELKTIKDNLSKKEKVQEVLDKCHPFFNNTHYIVSALQLLNESTENFDDCINDVNNIFEKFNDSLENIGDDDIGDVLDRIEALSKLQKKYGTIEDAIKYKDNKIKELEGYENISFEKAILEKNINKLSLKVEELSSNLTTQRTQYISVLENAINEYLKYLYLDGLEVILNNKELDDTGNDEVIFTLNGITLNKISSGEFNRLRLALLAARSKYECQNSGILFLDEIDANLSGKESESIAKVLNDLSKYYQIFAISHQPQLSATASQHFLVEKTNGVSKVTLLTKEQRVSEISRMISGENITDEAIKFAKKLLS